MSLLDHEIVLTGHIPIGDATTMHYGKGQITWPVRLQQYPSGEPLVQHADMTRPDLIDGVESIVVRQKSYDAFMTAMFIVDAMEERGMAVPDLVLPFVPGARQDRLNPAGDFLFTIKTVAAEINRRGFDRVTVFDPHSDVTPALIDRCRVVSAADCWHDTAQAPWAKDRYTAVVAPDAGAEKRAGKVAAKLGIPVVYAWKDRDVETGRLTAFGLQEVLGELREGVLLVVDDICDGGGTFIGLADQLDAQDITADLYVTHGIFSRGTDTLLERYQRVITTDTVIPTCEGSDVICIVESVISENGEP